MDLPIVATIVVRNALTREGLRRILSDGGYKVAQSIQDLDALVDTGSHIIIIDQSIVEYDGVDRISPLKSEYCQSKLVILTERYDFDAMSRMFAAGAHGYVLNDVPYQTFLAKMTLVAMGEKVAPKDFVDTLQSLPRSLASDGEGADINAFDLTPRERDVLRRLVLGMPNKVISRDLGVSEATIKLTVKGVFRKLSVRNRTQAAILAQEKGLLPVRAGVLPLLS